MEQPTRPRYNAEIFISEADNGNFIDATFAFRPVLGNVIPPYKCDLVCENEGVESVGAMIDEIINNAIDYAKGYQFNNEE